ncbi:MULTISPECIES: ATP-binding cassette domain-containing protein [unclassified Roseitalea]|uniref:thiamine ABC transporter ATP-binding protein n=1 Tax=unclassified Roseitalea TaxID=2639107 RepID=UPI00273F2106|nr:MULTISPECIES: ATP-binding cassette domain-containing protein [unclassified Roseitalea]
MRFDCAFASAAITAVMGPSGSGKSTLISLIAGFERPLSGRVRIGGRDVTSLAPANRPVSCVFQENNLFAHLDVRTNVGLGISPRMRLDARDRARLSEALTRVGLAGYEARRPGELSGGERQRVALARALVRACPVLILDEAFGSLGPALRLSMLDLVADLHRSTAMTVIMVTHEPEDARRIARDVVFLAEGAVHAQGPLGNVLEMDDNGVVRAYLGRHQGRS